MATECEQSMNVIKWGISIGAPIVSALAGVFIGSWLSSKQSKQARKHSFIEKQLGQFSDAEQSLNKSLELDSKQITPLLNLAIVQQKQDKLDSAIKNYKKVLENKENADAYFGLGFCYFKKNELENSIKNFSLAIEKNKFLLDAYINLGAIHERLEQLPEAEKVLVDALNISPNNARAHNNLAVVYEKAMAIGEAIKCYQDAIKFNHPRKEELKVRVQKMKKFMGDQ